MAQRSRRSVAEKHGAHATLEGCAPTVPLPIPAISRSSGVRASGGQPLQFLKEGSEIWIFLKIGNTPMLKGTTPELTRLLSEGRLHRDISVAMGEFPGGDRGTHRVHNVKPVTHLGQNVL